MKTSGFNRLYATLLGVALGAFAVAVAAYAGADPVAAGAALVAPACLAMVVRAANDDLRIAEAAALAASLFPKTPADRWAELSTLEAKDPDLHARTLQALRDLHAAARWGEGPCCGGC